MITLYSYPELFGVADNNGYGLKVFAFLRLNGMPFKHEHVFDASAAPRGQLPYIVDDGETVGDSDTIIAHVIAKNRLKIDAALTAGQRDMSLLITRMLDDLYWVMSYSRWKDERFWPTFRDALLRISGCWQSGSSRFQMAPRWATGSASATGRTAIAASLGVAQACARLGWSTRRWSLLSLRLVDGDIVRVSRPNPGINGSPFAELRQPF